MVLYRPVGRGHPTVRPTGDGERRPHGEGVPGRHRLVDPGLRAAHRAGAGLLPAPPRRRRGRLRRQRHRDQPRRWAWAASSADLLWKVPIAAAYALLYALTPLRVAELWWTWPLFLLAQDFCYYWSHRSHHMIRILWASHVVHHSSQRFNLSTALRQPWTGLTSWVFYLPLIAGRRPPGGGRVLRLGQPALPVLDPHRADRQDAALVRGRSSTPRRTTGCTTRRRAATSTATSAAS